ncbi:hypothetical protein BerOc1_03116 [Pseudodesulfovibrio hydrargyri]|uniref:Uncharacterized protein n=1 Tax=Pseudodesulfovibrio hydrargyri TaxID=2125990 RepID=A0A1J5N6B8_9BACT|nr:hypothetical protein [Pseudodesulfovibrio hydrargyri]OIQ51171.1 hypothetical protein BerOc1_03116 [Pseudodesulfovibrio hydrargyri]
MEHQYHGIGFLAFTALFFLAGFLGLYRAWRKGGPASNIRFVNHGAMGRTSLNYNWMKDDNAEEPDRRR